MLSQVTAKNVLDVFSETQCSWDSNNGTCFCCISAWVLMSIDEHWRESQWVTVPTMMTWVLFVSLRLDVDDAGLKLLRGLQTVKFDVEDMRRQEKHLPPADGMSFMCLLYCELKHSKAVFDLTESRFSFIVNLNLDSLANHIVWICGCCRKWRHCDSKQLTYDTSRRFVRRAQRTTSKMLETLCAFEANLEILRICQIQQNKNTVLINQNYHICHFFC